jgi:type VI protein secretion system component Hcp
LTATVDGVLYHQNTSTFTNIVPILGFTFSANASKNVGAGGVGAVTTPYTPVTLYKEMDVSSPLLLKILITNEIFQATISAVETASSRIPHP